MLERAGVTIIRREGHRVSQSLYLLDPDGDEIELCVDADPQGWRHDPAAVARVRPLDF